MWALEANGSVRAARFNLMLGFAPAFEPKLSYWSDSQCVRNGDYADPRDVMVHMQPSQCRDYILRVLEEVGIR